MKILIINGPNLNFLGIREKKIYGTESYNTLVQQIQEHAAQIGAEAEVWQSNHEGAIIDKLQVMAGKESADTLRRLDWQHGPDTIDWAEDIGSGSKKQAIADIDR